MFENEPRLVHVYVAIRRKKENPGITCKQELCFREIIYSEDGTEELKILKIRISVKPGVWRIYKTVNARNTDVARNIMLHWNLDGLYSDKRWDSVYSKALMQKQCRAEKKALVDIDTGDYDKAKAVMKTIEKWCITKGNPSLTNTIIQTPNGWHFICQPFDKSILDDFDYADVDYDRLHFVELITI